MCLPIPHLVCVGGKLCYNNSVMSKLNSKRKAFKIKKNHKRSKKLFKLRQKYQKAKSKGEKDKVLEKVFKVSPWLSEEEFLSSIKESKAP